jgi:hypothetical protein
MSGGILVLSDDIIVQAMPPGSKQKQLADLGIRLGGASSSFYETTEGFANCQSSVSITANI